MARYFIILVGIVDATKLVITPFVASAIGKRASSSNSKSAEASIFSNPTNDKISLPVASRVAASARSSHLTMRELPFSSLVSTAFPYHCRIRYNSV